MARWRHYCTPFYESEKKRKRSNSALISGVHNLIHSDSSCNWRPYLDIPFQGAQLPPQKRAAKKDTPAVKVTVEWVYKKTKKCYKTIKVVQRLKTRKFKVGFIYFEVKLLKIFLNMFQPHHKFAVFQVWSPNSRKLLFQITNRENWFFQNLWKASTMRKI